MPGLQAWGLGSDFICTSHMSWRYLKVHVLLKVSVLLYSCFRRYWERPSPVVQSEPFGQLPKILPDRTLGLRTRGSGFKVSALALRGFSVL